MLLTITTTYSPATDLGFLLHKHPDRFQSFRLPFGQLHVGYPEATEERCTAAIVLDVDPLALTRRRHGPTTLYEYVNDRPYVASSFFSVALARVFASALKGRSESRAHLVDAPIPLVAAVTAVTSADGEDFIRGLFSPLDYEVSAERLPLDDVFPQWGPSDHYRVTLSGTRPLRALLSHLYVLLPVLDDAKHYWVSEDEIAKLLRYGSDWLASHPLRDEISHRYLRRLGRLSRKAVERLEEEASSRAPEASEAVEEHRAVRPRLRDVRMDAVVGELKASGARTVLDLGCGEGALLERLVAERQFTRVVGVDVAIRSLQRARRRLRLEQLDPSQRARFELLQSSLTYRDRRLDGFDAAAAVEVVEHLDPHRLAAFELAVFAAAKPSTVILTTPNADYNVRFDELPAGTLRHTDHRFEWTREEFRQWAEAAAGAHGYTVRLAPVGDDEEDVGPPTQMAVFTRRGALAEAGS